MLGASFSFFSLSPAAPLKKMFFAFSVFKADAKERFSLNRPWKNHPEMAIEDILNGVSAPFDRIPINGPSADLVCWWSNGRVDYRSKCDSVIIGVQMKRLRHHLSFIRVTERENVVVKVIEPGVHLGLYMLTMGRVPGWARLGWRRGVLLPFSSAKIRSTYPYRKCAALTSLFFLITIIISILIALEGTDERWSFFGRRYLKMAPSLCPSVRPSVTFHYRIEWTQCVYIESGRRTAPLSLDISGSSARKEREREKRNNSFLLLFTLWEGERI